MMLLLVLAVVKVHMSLVVSASCQENMMINWSGHFSEK